MKMLITLLLILWSTSAAAAELEVPVQYHTLGNGLKVVLSEDHGAPTTTVAVYYGIGFRMEPKSRTGFAHLFEHLMFQGSKNLRSGEFISLVTGQGGILTGSTSFDFTNYAEIVPSHKTETFLWAEADRMRSLDITQSNLTNQQGVVKNEVMSSVLNQPYGGFPWLDLPQLANENWHNAHNFYGDLKEIDAATLGEVQDFFNAYYAPNNAVLIIAGDIDPDQVMGWVNRYFGNIPRSEDLRFPDIVEPRQEREKRREKVDPLATRPALAWGYHMPERGTRQWYAMVLIDAMLAQGADSRLYRKLVQEKGYSDTVTGGVSLPRNDPFSYSGPMLWAGYLLHDSKQAPEAIIADIDAIVSDLQTNLVDEAELTHAKTKMRSRFYDKVGDSARIGLADMLAIYALYDDDPSRINGVMDGFRAVNPELIRETAREYLRPTNRSIIVLKPGADGA